ESLKELTLPEDDKRAPLDAMGIVDPWGGTFRYDPSNCQPETGRPRISTVTPDGTELSNW
ncbi:MAG TPA: hypothetical protein VFW33_18040, partial [Gemmataceae bacterium]|nr:hypothetical protein [Gemmataceae bacterium]